MGYYGYRRERGDAYAAYPYAAGGFLSSLGKGIKKVVGGVVGTAINLSPIGTIVKGATGGRVDLGAGAARLIQGKPKAQLQLPPISVGLPGGFSVSAPQGINTAAFTEGGACPKGFRLNKTGYFLQDGTFVPPGSKCVRIRSMNPLNPRALRKGLSRAERFEKFARRTVNALRRGQPKFKRRAKRK